MAADNRKELALEYARSKQFMRGNLSEAFLAGYAAALGEPIELGNNGEPAQPEDCDTELEE